jgi:undecaprenyl-diphosphatase
VKLDHLEMATSRWFNRVNAWPVASRIFGSASYLGNGLLWYLLMLSLLLVEGLPATPVVLCMGAVGAIGTLLYKGLKHSTARPRPCEVRDDLIRTVEPLDRFSFPSGHTLHAVAFTMVAISAYPVLAWYLVPFTVIVAASRLVLGLHYPSDVLAGAAVGALTAGAGMEVARALGAPF